MRCKIEAKERAATERRRKCERSEKTKFEEETHTHFFAKCAVLLHFETQRYAHSKTNAFIDVLISSQLTHGINIDTCAHLGDAVGGSAGFRGVALVDGLQERQEVVVAGFLFFLGRVGLAEFRLERFPVIQRQATR